MLDGDVLSKIETMTSQSHFEDSQSIEKPNTETRSCCDPSQCCVLIVVLHDVRDKADAHAGEKRVQEIGVYVVWSTLVAVLHALAVYGMPCGTQSANESFPWRIAPLVFITRTTTVDTAIVSIVSKMCFRLFSKFNKDSMRAIRANDILTTDDSLDCKNVEVVH